MRPSPSRFTTTIVVALLVVACTSATSPAPAGTPLSTSSPASPSAAAAPSTTPSATLDDTATPIWTDTGGMRAARLDHTAMLLLDGRVLVAGGAITIETLPAAETFDLGSGS
jgi:hypothetical protein